MVEELKTSTNWLLLVSIFMVVICFIGTSYYFKAEVDNHNQRVLLHTNKVCVDQINARKADLIRSCETQVSSEDKKLCNARNDERFVKLEVICPREIGALKSSFNTIENQVVPFFKAALCTVLLWLIGLGGYRIYLKSINK